MVNMVPAGENAYFYQWDRNAALLVSGCEEVHFCHAGDEKAIVVDVKYHHRHHSCCHCDPPEHGHVHRPGVAYVPASLLESDEPLIAYGYDNTNTLSQFEFAVRHRPRPSHYVPPSETPRWEQLAEELKKKLTAPRVIGNKGDVLVANGYGLCQWVPAAEVIGQITDYATLSNKPRINGVELLGDKSFESLGLEDITVEEIDSLFGG